MQVLKRGSITGNLWESLADFFLHKPPADRACKNTHDQPRGKGLDKPQTFRDKKDDTKEKNDTHKAPPERFIEIVWLR